MAQKAKSDGSKRVAIYIRVSTLHQIDKDSLPMQRQDLIQYASLMLGTSDYVIFEDAGYSGKNTMRPKYQEMMTQIRAGLFSHILVWKIDRISRNLLDFATMYQELKDLGVVFVSKNEQFDTSTAMGEAMLKIILVFAELERNMTSERVTATMISRAGNGLWNGGRVPFGYKWDSDAREFSFNEDEKQAACLIHDKYEEMRSLIRLARWMNERGYRTRAGYEWSPTTLMIILRNVFYCGDYRYNVLKSGDRSKRKDESEWVTVKDHHIAMVSREQKEHIISILETNKRLVLERGAYQAHKNIHVFKGIVFCGECGKAMRASMTTRRADGLRYSLFVCQTRRKSNACNGKATSDPILGEFVFNYILNLLNAQKEFASIGSPSELQSRLLAGDTFSYISSIEPDGLNDLFNVLASGKVSGAIYGKSVSIPTKQAKVNSELSRLRNEKVKMERALDRLTNLFLYSENALSEKDFIIQKARIIDSLDELNEQIGLGETDSWGETLSDEEFMQMASEFIIAQKLSDRKYINYKRLFSSVDPSVLRDFVVNVIDRITMLDGKVKSITFKNGISHSFVFAK